MKKFLSLLLTFALTMSLIVLPAKADNVSVTGVTLSGNATLDVGGTKKLTATVKPDNATNKKVTWKSDDTDVATVENGTITAKNAGTATITVTTEDGGFTATCTVTVNDKYVLTATPDKSTLYYNGDDAYQSAAFTYTLKKNDETVDKDDYSVELSATGNKVEIDENEVTLKSLTEATTVKITATAKLGGDKVAEKEVTLTVANRYKADIASSALKPDSVMVGKTLTLKQPTLYDNQERKTVTDSYTVEFSADDSGKYISVGESTGKVTAKAAGTAHVIAEIKYGNLVDTSTRYTIVVDPISLAVKLDSVANGDEELWDDDDLEDAVIDALKDAISSYSGNKKVTSVKVTSNSVTGGKLYDDKNKALTSSVNLMDESDFTFEATAGYIGKAEFKIEAVIDGEEYGGTLTIPVTAENDDIDATVGGEEYSSTQISFALPDDYSYWFIYIGSTSFKNTMYEEKWSKSGSEPSNWKRYAAGDTCKINAKYDDGDVTLYVVGLDKDGIASTGKLNVALNTYDIEYSGAVGEKIAFDQDDFEDFLEERAEDEKIIGTKNSTAYVEFKNVTFTVPNEKTQGVLYDGSSKIAKSTTKCTDMDDITFVPASKAGSEVYIRFTLTYDYYKNNKDSTKASEKTMSGGVRVNVVHEDITYTVPANGSVVFSAEDFRDFFTDTYKSGTLNYVTFNKLPTTAQGTLYATYNAAGVGVLAKTNNKFYYDSGKASDYDLDDVSYKAYSYAKTGDKVYLPFTAYGTKSSQKVDGCVVITLTAARTMNFTDVKAGEWYYNNVKNAYAMGLIEGKTTTTFGTNDNMTWSEAVTLAARMNELYTTGKVTLKNSTSGNWYSSYETYAISKGIISSALGTKASTKISRRDYVNIFYNALPASAYTARNSITKIPDLTDNADNAKIYAFYRAGILTGYGNTSGKANGTFGPNDDIKRCEVATILIRMMDSSTRVYFTL